MWTIYKSLLPDHQTNEKKRRNKIDSTNKYSFQCHTWWRLPFAVSFYKLKFYRYNLIWLNGDTYFIESWTAIICHCIVLQIVIFSSQRTNANQLHVLFLLCSLRKRMEIYITQSIEWFGALCCCCELKKNIK